jgi:hypothetical protein
MSVISQRSFGYGEISPEFYPRVGSEAYQSGLKTCRNAWVKKAGGLENRSGTEHVGVARKWDNSLPIEDDSLGVNYFAPRVIEFIYNETYSYLIVMEIDYLSFVRNGDFIYEASQSITSYAAGVFTKVAHGYVNTDVVKITCVLSDGTTYIREGVITSAAADTFVLVTEAATPITLPAAFSSGTMAKRYRISWNFSFGGIAANPFNYRFTQSGTTLYFTHAFGMFKLAWGGADTSWTKTNLLSFGNPDKAAPGSLSSSLAGTSSNYVATAISSTTGAESFQSSVVATSGTPTSGTPATITIGAVAGVSGYNVYRHEGTGLFGFVGTTTTTTFVDRGFTPNTAIQPPNFNPIVYSSGNYPTAISVYQQRISVGNLRSTNVEFLGFTNLGQFEISTQATRQITSDDGFALTLVSRRVNAIRHLVDLGRLIAFTETGEVIVNSEDLTISATTIFPKTQTYNGASNVRPVVIDDSALYIQARGNTLRDLAFNFETEGYRGNDLTFTAKHLFEGHTIVDLAYQQTPHSIVWLVRDDGVLLSCTYVKEQGMIAWHRHDTDGSVKSVAVVPEDGEDAVYISVIRNLGYGTTGFYIERLSTRYFNEDEIEDMKFMDASASYDGTNTTVTTMTLSGGTNWTYDEDLTLTSSASYFTSNDVGNEIHVYDSDGEVVRLEITAYTSATVVTVRSNRTVPAELRAVSTATWGKAVDQVLNLWQLENKQVSVVGDGTVVANPNNAAYGTPLTVTNGTITLDDCYVKIHVGLPYITDIETLDVDTAQGESRINKGKLVNKVNFRFQKTRGVFVGPNPPSDDDTDPLEDLEELKIRNSEDYDDPVALTSDTEEVLVRPEWNSNGRVFVRQVDPLPMSILSIHPEGVF